MSWFEEFLEWAGEDPICFGTFNPKSAGPIARWSPNGDGTYEVWINSRLCSGVPFYVSEENAADFPKVGDIRFGKKHPVIPMRIPERFEFLTTAFHSDTQWLYVAKPRKGSTGWKPSRENHERAECYFEGLEPGSLYEINRDPYGFIKL